MAWAEMAGRSVLITGAAGFLPSYLVETLLRWNEKRVGQPIHVVALVRNRARAAAKFAHHRGRRDFLIIEHDVASGPPPLDRADFIIHAASQASPRFYGTDPVGTLEANALGAHHLLQFAARCSVERFLFFSSGEVYGAVTEVPTPETAFGPLDPATVRSCYAESKRLAETLCVSWSHQHGVPATIVRPYHTYGPGIDLDDGRIFSDLVADVVARRDLVLTSDGSATRAFCYVADATWGFFKVLLEGQPGQAYNIGNQEAEVSILALATTLAGLFPERDLQVQVKGQRAGPYMPSATSRSAPDVSKARTLGWHPSTGLAEGFARTIRSFEPDLS